MKLRSGLRLATIGVLSALVIGSPALAYAEGGSSKGESAAGSEVISRSETALELHGYDAKVAADNGYQIVTDEAGNQTSVPVTPAAVEFDEQLKAEATASRTVIYGGCGSSFIGVTRNGNHIMVGTGYKVYRPVVGRVWTIQVYGASGLPSFGWSGPSGSSWNSAASFFYTSGGFANVTPGSSVVLDNGAICWSGAPGENF